jgi:hypothetical protein
MDLKRAIAEFRRDGSRMDQALAAFGMAAVFMLSVTFLRMDGGYAFAAPQHQPSPHDLRTPIPQEAAEAANLQEKYELLLLAYGELKTACMDGVLRITWIDPHTKKDKAAVCDVVTLGRIP